MCVKEFTKFGTPQLQIAEIIWSTLVVKWKKYIYSCSSFMYLNFYWLCSLLHGSNGNDLILTSGAGESVLLIQLETLTFCRSTSVADWHSRPKPGWLRHKILRQMQKSTLISPKWKQLATRSHEKNVKAVNSIFWTYYLFRIRAAFSTIILSQYHLLSLAVLLNI